jgi:entericidin B
MIAGVKDYVSEHRAGVQLMLSVLLLAGALLALGGCNTMEGAGQDVEAAGDAMSDTAEDVQN